MTEAISIQTLVVAIKSVNVELRRLKEEVLACANDDNNLASLQELDIYYWKAAEELKDAYTEAQKCTANFPLYSDLISHEE